MVIRFVYVCGTCDLRDTLVADLINVIVLVTSN